MRIWTTELLREAGNEVELEGWLHHQRQLSRVSFLLLRDGKGISQIVVTDADDRARLGELTNETVIRVRGSSVLTEQAPGGVEMHDPTIEVITPVNELPPIELRRPVEKEQLPFLLDHAALSLRHPRRRAAFRLGALSLAGMRKTLDANGFVEIQTPKIVASATETGANVFKLDYFGRPAYLAQSPQFYKQIMVGVFERVYEIGPVFRAEPHDTARHLAEYVSLDVELGFIRDHFDVMKVCREVIGGMVAEMRERGADQLALIDTELPGVPDEIPHIFFREAQELIERETGEKGVVGEPDLAPAHERFLGEWSAREHGSDFLFVTGYPMAKRPFYTHPDPARPEFSNSFDLLFRGLELVTGGQRLHVYDDYVRVLEANGQDLEPYESYLEAFKYGMPPHGGFAIGWERWMARLLEVANIRETTLFPRDINRVRP
jgi:nondiscriminating aspartyl-tRNA synthetase